MRRRHAIHTTGISGHYQDLGRHDSARLQSCSYRKPSTTGDDRAICTDREAAAPRASVHANLITATRNWSSSELVVLTNITKSVAESVDYGK